MNDIIPPDKTSMPQDVEELAPPEELTPEKQDPKDKKKKSWLKRLLTFFGYGVLCFILLLLIAGIVISYYFPSERLTPIAEKELSRILKIPVSIDSLDISLLSGLKISQLKLGQEPSILSIQNVVLDYDLTQLIKGRFTINEVSVDQPELNLISVNGVWNFQPLLELGGPKQRSKPAPAEEKPAGLPPLPIAINLSEFSIRNVRVNLDMDGETKSRLEGLNVNARGKLEPEEIDIWLQTTWVAPQKGQHNLEFSSSQGEGIEVKTLALMNVEVSTQDLNDIRLTGDIGFKKNQIQIGDPLPAPDFSAEIGLEAGVKEESLKIQKMAFHLSEKTRVDLSVQADRLTSNPRFNIRLNEAAFNIEELIEWAGTLIPPLEAGGNVRVSGLEIKGSLPGFKPGDIETLGGKISVKDFFANHPPLSAKLKGVDAEIDLTNAKLVNGVPENLDGKIQLKINRGQAQNLTVNDLSQNLKIQAKGSNLSEVALTFSTAIKNLEVIPPEMDRVKTGVDLKGSAKANWQSGDIHFFNVDYSLGSAVGGKVQGRAKNFGKASFKVEQDIDIQLKPLRSLVPQNLLQKIDGFPSAGTTKVHAVVQGRLDENFQPIQALLNTEIKLQGIDSQLKNPPVEVKQVSSTITFPVDYIPAKGVKIPRLEVETRIDQVKALDKVELGPMILKTDLTMSGYYPLTGEPGKIPITNKTSIQLDRVQSLDPELVVTGLAIDTSLKSDLYAKDFKNAVLKGTVSILDVEGVQEIKTGKIQTSFAVDVNDLSLTQTKTAVDLKIDPPSPEKLDGKIPVGPITFTSSSTQNLKTGEFDIDKVSLIAPSLVNLDVKAELKNWGKTFDVDSTVTETELAAIWKNVPKAFKEGMEDLEVAGSVDLSLDAKGEIPEKFELKKTSLPIVAKAGFQLGGASLSWPSQSIAVEDMNTSTLVNFQDGNGTVSGNVSLAKLFLKNILGEDWLDPKFDFKYSLADFNKFTLDTHEFSIKKYGVLHSMAGSVDGLKPFLTGKIPLKPKEMSRRLDISLTTNNQLQFKKAISEGTQQFLQGIQAHGALLATLGLKMVSGERVAVDGRVEFEEFNAQIPDVLKVTRLNGKFPFNKTLFFERVLVKTLPESFLASRKGFFTQLRDFSKHKNNFTIQEIEAAGQKVSHIGLDVLFKNNRLLVEKFLFDILDGSVAGNLFVIPTPEGPELSFSTEFAGLNFGGLVGFSKEAEKSESEIDGNMQLGLKLKQGQESEPISIDQIVTRFAITRIGAKTLDRFLLFLDPEESRPAIVDTRAKLKLASPHRILVTVENGNLNVEAWLKNKVLGDIIKAPELKRVPVTSLKQFKDVTGQLENLTGLRDALKYLAARGIEFDEEGKILLY
ncbi:MAG: hypothetical protein NPINA01_00430 [Nitrospinaceae bacterium]|nr:MAG: hypothetical protein NPINA01_00430 [Nitrospinaceae bacterium]